MNSTNNKSTPNIILLGPSAERYKGGIAQFTSHLASQLEQAGSVEFVSWSQLYPSFLTSRNFFDQSSNATISNSKANFLLAYMNPFSWLYFVYKCIKRKPDFICLTWVHPVHAPIYIVVNMLLKLFCSTEIVYICHNILPHESFRGSRLLTRIALSTSDRLIVHSSSEKKLATELTNNAEITQLFLPLHNFFSSVENSAKEPDSNEYLQLLFFGSIRHYKGVDVLIDAMHILKKCLPNIRLKIIGEPFYKTADKSSLEYLCQQSEIERRIADLQLQQMIKSDFRYIANEEVPELFYHCDIAIFPYRSATQSGPITVAYSFDKPVISTRVGGIPDVVLEGISGYLVEPEDSQALADAIIKFSNQPIKKEGIRKVAALLSWKNYIEGLVYKKCINISINEND